jgi:beta-mannosidase
MRGRMSLNGTWKLSWAEGDALMNVGQLTADKLGTRFSMDAHVPAPIHKVLMDAGMLEDVNIGMNSLKARWVEEMYWVYRRHFSVSTASMNGTALLKFNRLELDAEVFLNNELIGTHRNAHRPAEFDVTGKLKHGENLLVVKLESGMHSNSNKQGTDYGTGDIGKLTKRHWNRHSQCQHGWDWQARLVNIGILGDVELEWNDGLRMDDVTVFAIPADDLKTARFTIRASIHGLKDKPADANLRARIRETGQEVKMPVSIEAGKEEREEITIDVECPKLWWPLGYGSQPLYHVEVSLLANNEIQSVVRRTGVRKVEMDQSKHPVEGKFCTLNVNNTPIFCKGGNWVPADMLYSTVSPEKYRQIAQIAKDANFNMLRIWGGGIFADQALCEFCDENGIMIWHDFLFACAQYPMQDPEFAKEVHKELTFATRSMAHHPAMVVWCGSNEIEWGDWSWEYDNATPAHPHYVLFHRDIPVIIKREDPSTLHWISSPSSPDYEDPASEICGDQHPWFVSLGAAGGADFHVYRNNVDRFPNEGGVLGAVSPATLKQFLPKNEQYILSPSWDHHDNTFAAQDSNAGEPGHAYQTVSLWTGLNPLEMNWEDYAFVSALMQAEGLAEYINNYRRRKYSSASAIFWMFNDAWPATHAWTIIDYYLRRKLSFCPVKRAFAPVTTVVAEDAGQIKIFGVNEMLSEMNLTLRYGLVSTLTAEWIIDEKIDVTLQANASTMLASFSKEKMEQIGTDKCVAVAVLMEGDTMVSQHRMMTERFKDMQFANPNITIEKNENSITLNTDIFAWGVCLDINGEMQLEDNCIDLLPGVPYTIKWNKADGDPKILKVGNTDTKASK